PRYRVIPLCGNARRDRLLVVVLWQRVIAKRGIFGCVTGRVTDPRKDLDLTAKSLPHRRPVAARGGAEFARRRRLVAVALLSSLLRGRPVESDELLPGEGCRLLGCRIRGTTRLIYERWIELVGNVHADRDCKVVLRPLRRTCRCERKYRDHQYRRD